MFVTIDWASDGPSFDATSASHLFLKFLRFWGTGSAVLTQQLSRDESHAVSSTTPTVAAAVMLDQDMVLFLDCSGAS